MLQQRLWCEFFQNITLSFLYVSLIYLSTLINLFLRIHMRVTNSPRADILSIGQARAPAELAPKSALVKQATLLAKRFPESEMMQRLMTQVIGLVSFYL